jgi:hypothetical protein
MKTPASRLCFWTFAVLAVLASQAKANLIVDPGFEVPTVPSASYTDFTTGMTFGGTGGWVVQGSDVAIVNTTATAGNLTANANSGFQSLDLTGGSISPSTGVSQAVPTTQGVLYSVSFFLGRGDDSGPGSPGNYSGSATASLSIGGGPAVLFTNSNVTADQVNWQSQLTSFTAGPGTSTTLTFLAAGASPTVQFIGLDDVSVTANTVTAVVPEPNTLALVGFGAVLVSWAKFRRRRKLTTA